MFEKLKKVRYEIGEGDYKVLTLEFDLNHGFYVLIVV